MTFLAAVTRIAAAQDDPAIEIEADASPLILVLGALMLVGLVAAVTWVVARAVRVRREGG